MKKVMFLVVAIAFSVELADAKAFDREALDRYSEIQQALAKDSLKDAKAATGAFARMVSDPTLKTSTQKISKAKSLDEAREGFKELSKPIVSSVKKEKNAGYEVYSCPMAKAEWVQKAGSVENPFLGKDMLSCGEAVR